MKRKKIAFILVLVFMFFAILVVCVPDTSGKNIIESDRFYYIDAGSNGISYDTILVDKNTGVMYLFHGHANRGGLTLMVDAENRPLIYDGKY